MTRDQAKVAIQKLIERFAEHRKAYHAADYNEAKTRQDFINPFFKTLGWDVDNENGMSEAYREVIYEDKVVVKGKAKAPDYGFRLMGQGKKRLFYVEAKKPSVALKTNKEAAYQLRRYGSSAQAPISILTNFEDFFVYDCSKVPNQSDSANVSRLKHIGFEDYIKEFDFIYDTFSHEAVTKGRFDKFVQSDANKKGSQTLDKEFVQSLDTWRKYLATSIAVNNKKINDEELNFCVQLIIDRLIFLRFCEDRSVEPYGQLQSAASKGNAYNNLFELFEQADAKYNSGLFDFEKDQLTSKLKIDNKVVKNIVEDLYYPQCRYEFSVMPVEVLGNAYEQFLGKVIRITPARGVKIEEKPEVRKAGGVFYTPQYIVDYIVKNTVGKLINGKAPKEIDKIKIVDPACGSGSFLVGAFEYLLHYHTDWYYHNLSDKEKKKGDIITPDGKLTTHEKKRILINNIYGVDLDANAVEVSKLSLLLKCMEGETEASIKQQVTMFHERILPDLDNNVKDGNSLVDTDFYDEQIDLGFEKKIKPFSWQKNFPNVFKQGGFDIVIGNPPYVRQEIIDNTQKNYFSKKYRVYNGLADLYTFFFEKGIELLAEKGVFSIIVANKWMKANYGEPLRKWLKTQNVNSIIDFGDIQIFDGATTYPCIIICSKEKPSKKIEITNVKTIKFDSLEKYVSENRSLIDQESLSDEGWNLSSQASQAVLSKVKAKGQPLDKFVKGRVFRGVVTGLNEAFVIDESIKNNIIKKNPQSKKYIKPYLRGRDIFRYGVRNSNLHLLYIPWDFNTKEHKLIMEHLLKFKKELNNRPEVQEGRFPWYALSRYAADYVHEFEKEKIVYQVMQVKPCFALDSTGFYCNNSIWFFPEGSKYLVGVLNSKLGWFLISNYCTKIQNGFQLIYKYLENIPIVEPINNSEKLMRDEIIKNVDFILKLNEELLVETINSNLNKIKQRIEQCEEKINELVYSLYNLTIEEIKTVEGGSNE